VTARDQMLARVRGALGRSAKSGVAEPPPVRLRIPENTLEDRVSEFAAALTALGGSVTVVKNMAAAKSAVRSIIGDRSFAVSSAGILKNLGLEANCSRGACSTAEFGVSSADFALADTGSLVFLSESRKSRLISLLPPRHIAVISREKIVSGLDELFTMVPEPAAHSSSMVIVTGPSRTADIEMRLVRGVHGPGDIHVMIVQDVTLYPSNASEET